MATQREGAGAAHDERTRRWRLILGGGEADCTGMKLSTTDMQIDRALGLLYGSHQQGSGSGVPGPGNAQRSAGLGSSAPEVARWLGDIRGSFPSSVVRVLQRDAMDRLGLTQLLMEPELLEAVQPDVHLAATLVSMSRVMPEQTRETARIVVRRVLDDLERRLANPLRQAVTGSLNRSARNTRPRHNEIDWDRTIRANLRNYQPGYATVIPDRLIGFGRRRSSLRDIILCIDQSGSMAASFVYAGLFGAVLASLRSVSTRLIAFDTAVIDLSEGLDDPVDVLFAGRLGGGTDINQALAYCQELVRRPHDTVLVLISDLYEGGNRGEMLSRASGLVAAGVQAVALLALSDDGAPVYDHGTAAAFAALGIPAFACTPDHFPALMATALSRGDIGRWAAEAGIVTSRTG